MPGPEGGGGSGGSSPSATQEKPVSAPTQTASLEAKPGAPLLPPQELAHPGHVITDEERAGAFKLHTPNQPDLGGTRPEAELREVITGEVVENPSQPGNFGNPELPQNIADRLKAAEEAGFSPEHPMTSNPEEVIRKAEETLRKPKQPVGLATGSVLTPAPLAPAAEAGDSGTGTPDTPDGGDGGGGGEGEPPPPGPEYLWSPEFDRDGIAIFREIFDLEGEDYQDAYDPIKHPPKDTTKYRTRLNELYEEWKVWVGQKGEKSYKDKPFTASPEPEVVEPQQPQLELEQVAPTEQTTERDDLADLPSVRDLFREYQRLRIDEPDNKEGITNAEQSLSRYFKEAKRATRLLDTADASLGPIYKTIVEGLQQEKSPDDIWKEIEERKEVISRLGERAFLALRRSDRGRRSKELEKIDGVWEVYIELAVDRFSLLTEGEELDAPTIDGEFKFDISRMDFSTRTGEEGLRRFLATDAELRALSERSIVERDLSGMTPEERERAERERAQIMEVLERFSGGSEEELQRLNLNRQEVYQRLIGEREVSYRRNIQEREEARANLAGDREALRRLREERGDEELYWSPTYANYFTVSARTEHQFQAAVDTFIQWLRSGQTKSPNEIFQRVSGFKDALTTAGQRERVNVRNEFMIGLRQELEGLVGVSGADWANEHYNAQNFKQFMDFLAQDEGPARLIRLGKAHRGQVAKILWQFDNDPRLELLFSSHGSRGQLMDQRGPVEQETLQAEILNLLAMETMGSSIKSYDPDHPGAEGQLEENLEKLSKFRSDRKFKNLFEGFDQEDQERLYKELTQKQTRINRAREIREAQRTGTDLNDIQRRENEEGRLEDEPDDLTTAEKAALDRLERVRKIHQDYKNGTFNPASLKGEDRRLYEDARNAVTLAYEMYGVMGEKAKRGGGVFQVERNHYIEAYHKFKDTPDNDLTPIQRKEKRLGRILTELRTGVKKLDQLSEEDRQLYKEESGKGKFFDYVPIHWAEKFVQFAENWVRATYGGELDGEVQQKLGKKGISAAELKYRVDQARRMAIWAVKTDGFDAKLFDFTLLRDGIPVDPNCLGYSKYGIDVTKDSSNLEERIQRYKYAPPVDTRLLGYTSTGKSITINFDSEGKLKTTLLDPDGEPFDLEFDEEGNIIVYDEPDNSNNDRKRVLFDNLKKDTVVQPMLLKTPKENQDGTLVKNAAGEVEIDKVKVDFNTATHHFYSRWTGHPYWGYQEQDTELLLKAIKEARLVKEGKARPQDVSPHAIQLLIVDPTLQRVTRFRYKENREDRITLAAVEEKYQGHYRITDELHEAFYPADADDEYNRIVYNLQDHGGSTKMWENHRALNARWTDMLARRGRTLIPTLPLHFASMSEVWGAPNAGALDVLRMMAYGQYRMVGQFALEKWIGQTEAAQDLFEALYGYASPQEKRDREGYVEKPTDNADVVLQAWAQKIALLTNLEEEANEEMDIGFMDDVRKSRGRKETVMFRIRVLETTKRGERAPLWLEGIDIFIRNSDGSIKTNEDGEWVYNRAIDKNRDSGSSRHSATTFFWRDVRWLRSDKPGEGQDLYKDAARYYAVMDLPQHAARRLVEEKRIAHNAMFNNTRWHQELAKEVR